VAHAFAQHQAVGQPGEWVGVGQLFDAALRHDFGPFEAALNVKNLFDETYNAEFSPGGFVFRARPARYGFEVGYKF
jgi:outer membrane receptor protein involved in Fe transport